MRGKEEPPSEPNLVLAAWMYRLGQEDLESLAFGRVEFATSCSKSTPYSRTGWRCTSESGCYASSRGKMKSGTSNWPDWFSRDSAESRNLEWWERLACRSTHILSAGTASRRSPT